MLISFLFKYNLRITIRNEWPERNCYKKFHDQVQWNCAGVGPVIAFEGEERDRDRWRDHGNCGRQFNSMYFEFIDQIGHDLVDGGAVGQIIMPLALR